MAKRASARKTAKPTSSSTRPALKSVQAVAPAAGSSSRFEIPAIGAVLFALLFCIYLPVRHYAFVNFDDDLYVTLNGHVQAGLTWAGIKWAFTSVDLVYWQPLTWLSQMLDTQLFGLDPGARHLENAAFHAANTTLLFLVFQRMTKRVWPSAFVAGLFAFHPLRVESVAWIAERKDVLSAFFWLLTMWLYVRYTKRANTVNYLWVVAAFACGLLAKPMLVSLPFVLLLLDYWPLRRNGLKKLIGEKLPLLGMALVPSILAVRGQSAMGAVAPLPFSTRLAGALSGAVTYLGALLWPHDLTVMYPYQTTFSAAWIGFCILLLAALTAGAFFYRKRFPYLITGWLWYLIAIGPTLGLVQVGPQAYADRFTYLPCVGLLFAVVWLAADLSLPLPNRQWLAAGLGAILFSVLIWRSAAQLPVWQNSVILFTRAADVFPDSAINQHNLGFALAEAGQFDAAIPHYEAALHADPAQYKADYNLGRVLAQKGQLPEAIGHFENALKSPMAPMYESDVRNALGIAFAREQKLGEAQAEFQKAIALRPDSAELHANLASSLAAQGRPEEAVAEFGKAIALNPSSIQAHRNLAHAWLDLGRKKDAKNEFQILLQLAPDNPEARQQLDALKE